MQLRTEFADRADLHAYLRATFPEEAVRDDRLSPTIGGRQAAESALQRVQPAAYGRTRNALNGAVTRLSAYIRHGVLTLAEIRRFILAHAERAQADKLLNELAWRDYWQRLYARLGDKIWIDQEPIKTGVTVYAADLPGDIRAGETGLACVDGFVAELAETGYLHNHQRMWLAAYVVHFRRIRWQAGARWFLQHLIDGDPASNNLSWQWVASTFSHKPYIFNRENLERNTEGHYCRSCQFRDHGCPFQASYATLESRLFVPQSEGRTDKSRLQERRRR